MKRSTTISALILAGVIASPALVLAQDNPNSVDEQDTSVAMGSENVTDDGDNWGWIGLLGLAGLMGLKRRDRETHENVRTRQPV